MRDIEWEARDRVARDIETEKPKDERHRAAEREHERKETKWAVWLGP